MLWFHIQQNILIKLNWQKQKVRQTTVKINTLKTSLFSACSGNFSVYISVMLSGKLLQSGWAEYVKNLALVNFLLVFFLQSHTVAPDCEDDCRQVKWYIQNTWNRIYTTWSACASTGQFINDTITCIQSTVEGQPMHCLLHRYSYAPRSWNWW